MAIKILTDSTSYIDKGLIEQLNIKVISLNVTFEDESFKETEIDNNSFYKKMKEKGIPISSQPSAGEMKEAMVEAVKEGDSLVCIFLSSDMSGTYASAHLVREMVLEEYENAKIEIIDSRSNCMQLGFAVIEAARAAKNGKTLEEVKKAAEDNIRRSRFLFIPDNLQYLKKGGRIGTASALLGSFLKIIPILTVEDGKTTVAAKIRTKKNAVDAMVEKFKEDIEKYGLGEVVVHHIDCPEEAEELKSKIIAAAGCNIDIPVCGIGPVIGLHVGPKAVAVAYYTKLNMR